MVNSTKALKHAEGLPGLREVLKAKKGVIKSLGGNVRYFDMVWDMNEQAKEEQVFLLRTQIDGRRVEAYLSKQAFERFLRAV